MKVPNIISNTPVVGDPKTPGHDSYGVGCPFGDVPCDFAADSDSEVSFKKGFPSAFSSDGLGMRVVYSDVNKIGHIAAANAMFLQAGGLYTFDEDFSTAIGGYPKNSRLWFWDATNNKIRQVISLIENNTYDFVTTPSYIDNNHWAFCDIPNPILFKRYPSDNFRMIVELPYKAYFGSGRYDYAYHYSHTFVTNELCNVCVVGHRDNSSNFTLNSSRFGNAEVKPIRSGTYGCAVSSVMAFPGDTINVWRNSISSSDGSILEVYVQPLG